MDADDHGLGEEGPVEVYESVLQDMAVFALNDGYDALILRLQVPDEDPEGLFPRVHPKGHPPG